MNWIIARDGDDAALIEMCRELNREDPGPNPVPDDHMRRTMIALREHPIRGQAIILEHEGKVEGYALLASFWSNELGGEVCIIDELYVRPAHRGHGYATQLMKKLVNGEKCDFWPRKPVAIELEVTPNNTKARALYARLGFAPVRNAHMRCLKA